MAAIPDIVEFLRQYPPFAELDPAAVESLANVVEVEFHPAGEIIFSKGVQPVEFLRVIRSGTVEVVNDGRVLDLMGPGEMFGHASMLSGLPTGFEARAAEDTLTYRIPAQEASLVLAGPRGLRYMTRLLLEDRHHLRSGPSPDVVRDQLRQPVRGAIRGAPIICAPGTSVREAARQMTAVGASALIVDLGDTVGIVTDSDLRSRVVADGLSADSPVSGVMTAPAFTVPDERPGSEVLLDMLDRGVKHVPVTSPTGRVIGIVEDRDLVAIESRSSFHLRRAVARASTIEELVEASSKLRPAVVAMTRGGMTAIDVMSVFSVVADALTRRALDLAVAEAGEPPTRFTWLALGSQARREAVPSSDLDSAIAWFGDGDSDEPSVSRYFEDVATTATDILVRCGFRPDEHRASASDPLFVRSLSSWQQEARSFLDDPTQKKALVLVSVLVDSRPVWGVESEPLIAETFRLARAYPRLLHLLAQFALSHKPPVGFFRGLAIDVSGEGRSRLDLKAGAVVPITDLARWAGMTAGVACASTTARLSAAGDYGTLTASDALTLRDAFELVCQLRLDHQVSQLEAGVQPGDVIDLDELSPLIRSYLKEAFRAVVSVQRRIANDLSLGMT
jgi:CBS domain-containing protein